MRASIIFILLFTIRGISATDALCQENIFEITEYGAVPDGQTLSTDGIQKAIDACSEAGGGTVRISGGKFLSGTIFLKSNVKIEIREGSVLLGSTNLKHYPKTVPEYRSYTDNYTVRSLIYGEDLENVVLTGKGTIDGQGASFEGKYHNRPYILRIISSKNVLVEDLSMRNSPMWMQHYLACDSVIIRGIHVWNHSNKNNDGIDIDGCHHVLVENCVVDSDDDGICLKSTSGRLCEDVVIRGCTVRSHCNAIKCGTESNGGFKNIVIEECTLLTSEDDNEIYGRRMGLAALALEIVDGGIMEDVNIFGIRIEGYTAPVFMRLGDRGRTFRKGQERPGVGGMQNIHFSEITGSGSGVTGCVVAGIAGHPIRNISFKNIKLSFKGGGVTEDGIRTFDERTGEYPESTMFAERLPAYGIYFWHVDGLSLANIRLDTEQPDGRNAIIFEEVTDIMIDGKTYTY